MNLGEPLVDLGSSEKVPFSEGKWHLVNLMNLFAYTRRLYIRVYVYTCVCIIYTRLGKEIKVHQVHQLLENTVKTRLKSW